MPVKPLKTSSWGYLTRVTSLYARFLTNILQRVLWIYRRGGIRKTVSPHDLVILLLQSQSQGKCVTVQDYLSLALPVKKKSTGIGGALYCGIKLELHRKRDGAFDENAPSLLVSDYIS